MKINLAVLIGMLIVFGSGCAGGRNLRTSACDGVRWGSDYKRFLSEYKEAGTAEERNAAIEGLQGLVEKSPDSDAAARLRDDICVLAAGEGRSDVVRECTDSQLARALFKR